MASDRGRFSRSVVSAVALAIILIVSLFAALGTRAELPDPLGNQGQDTAPELVPGTFVGSSATPGTGAVHLPVDGKAPIIFLDPGHGGVDTGATGTTINGAQVDEKTLTLAIAQRTATKLRAAGFQVVLSRTGDSLPGLTADDLTADGKALTPQGVLDELQGRIDAANDSGASLLLSIHLNSFDDPSVGGAETYYDPDRPFSASSRRFANLVQQDLIAALRKAGYATPDRGVIDDTTLQAEGVGPLQGTYNHLVMLGPAIPGKLTPSDMPGALSESLFLSDPAEASAATQPLIQDLIAGAFIKAVEDYFGG